MGIFGWLGKKPGEEVASDPDQGPVARVEFNTPLSEVEDRFIDKGQLAKGGMGVIRRVFNRNLLRHEAMKVLDPAVAEDPNEVLRFLEEAQIAGQLEHPNIPAVHEVGITREGEHFFTMKLVRGKTLEEILASSEFSLEREEHLFEALQTLIKVCDAIGFAHSRGVIHCDLKPANVMVGRFGQVFVMDWGISRLRGGRRISRTELELAAIQPPPGPKSKKTAAAMPRRMTAELEIQTVGRDHQSDDGKVMGTLSFMAPEQARGQMDLIDERTDVFGIGGLLYRILTGRAPHVGLSPEESWRLARRCEVLEPQAAVEASGAGAGARLPIRLCRIAMKALSADPRQRYATAAELQTELEEFIRGAGRYPSREFAAGELVIRQGEQGDNAYVITKGRVRVFRTEAETTRTVRQLGPGEVFGETALLTDQPRNASVEAIEPVTAVVIARDALDRELGRTFWVGHILRAVTERFQDLDARLQSKENALEARVREAALRFFAFEGRANPDGTRSVSWVALRRHLRDALNLGDLEAVALAAGVRGLAIRAATEEAFLTPDPPPSKRRPPSRPMPAVSPTADTPMETPTFPAAAATMVEMPAVAPPTPFESGASPFEPATSAGDATSVEIPLPTPAPSPFEPTADDEGGEPSRPFKPPTLRR